ncbi:hypothetical protein BH11PLA1_BH11PLA1_18890 [soil metagenome]
MARMHVMVAGAAVMLAPALAMAQLMPTVPDAPAKAPAYVPPPAPPMVTPPAPPPAAPTIAAPELIKKDAAGRIERLTLPSEEAAMAALALDPASAAKRSQITLERRAYQDQLITAAPKHALELRRVVKNIDTINDTNVLVATRIQHMTPVMLAKKSLATMMVEGGGISAAEQKAITDASNAYNNAVFQETSADLRTQKADMGTAQLTWAKQNIPRSSVEFSRAFERMLTDLATRWKDVAAANPDIAGKLKDDGMKMTSASTSEAKADLVAAALAKLSDEEATKLLSMVATPMPAQPLTSMDGAPMPAAPQSVKIEPATPPPGFKMPERK